MTGMYLKLDLTMFCFLYIAVNLADGEEADANEDLEAALGEANNVSEKTMLDDAVGQIANLVVVAMKNFCASESTSTEHALFFTTCP
jgi:hypothetical protein